MLPPSAVQPELRPAFRVERYAVFDEFAAGGMATVHFARLLGAHGFRRTVAVKRLLPHLTRNREFALMLVDEARLAARIRHPNVVTTLDVVRADGELLLVMEYVHGESLAKLSHWARARGEGVPVPIACAIMADALHGLQAAHDAKDERGAQLGLVHRDVSPQNVLVGLDGIPRIGDFGVAKAAGRAQSTADGILKGKLAYMAPEQLSGGEVSRASDVFAAAIVLWEALTGEGLFAGRNHAETAFKVLSAPIPTPTSRGASIPASLNAVVMRGLARAPDQRFASARELALAIESCVPGVRPAELARWVEHTVADRLAARSAMLRAIEGSAELESHTHTQARRRGDAPAATRDHGEPLATPQAHASAADAVRRPRVGRYLALGALLALLAFVAFVALRPQAPVSPARAGLGAGPVKPPTVTAKPSTASTAEELPRVGEDAPPSATFPAPGSGSAATPTTLGGVAGVEREAAPEKQRARPETKARESSKKPTRAGPRASDNKRPGCDPPFTIDAAGHVLFKAECM